MNGPITQALKHLIAAGVTGDALVTAIAEIEAASTPVKSKGALRTERWRAKNKASQSVTERHGDGSAVVEGNSKPSKVKSELPSTSEQASQNVTSDGASRVSRGTRLPDDWKPKPNSRELWRNLGLPDDAFDDHADRYRCYWWSLPGQKGRRADWDLTWINRVKDIADHWKGNRNGSSPKRDSMAAGVDRVRDAIHRATSGDRGSGENIEPLSRLLKSA